MRNSRVEQLAARLAHNQEVAGSSPAPATSFEKVCSVREACDGIPPAIGCTFSNSVLPGPARVALVVAGFVMFLLQGSPLPCCACFAGCAGLFLWF